MKRSIVEQAIRKPLRDTTNLIIVHSKDQQDHLDQPPAKKKADLRNLQNGARFEEETNEPSSLPTCAHLKSPTMMMMASNSMNGNINNTVLPSKRQPQPVPSRTPYELWKDDFQSYLKFHGFIGSLVILGLPQDSRRHCHDPDIEHHRGGIAADRSNLNRQDLESLRYILITESRADKLDLIRNMILGEYTHPSQPVGTTDVIVYDQHGTFGRHVYQVWKHWNCRIMFNVKPPSERLDWLVAFTHTINDCDAWMYDDPEASDEKDIPSMVQSLAATWRRLFDKERTKKADLGWDQEYTRPGVLALLDQFRVKVEACPSLGHFDVLTEQCNP